VDVLFGVRQGAPGPRLHSCTVVYDEPPAARSPVTLFR